MSPMRRNMESVWGDLPGAQPSKQRCCMLESIALNVREAILVAIVNSADDRRPVIQFVNPAFTRLTGYQAGELIGQHLAVLWRPGSCGDKHVKAALTNGLAVEADLVSRRKDGSEFWSNVKIV